MKKIYDNGVCKYEYNEISSSYSVTKCPRPSTDIIIETEIDSIPVREIAPLAFSYKGNIQSISLPAHIERIGDYSFSACSSLKTLILPNGVKSIGEGAFSSCASLSVIVLPASVSEIGKGAIEDSDELESIYVQEGSFALDWIKECLPHAFEGGKVALYSSETEIESSPAYGYTYENVNGGISLTDYDGDGEELSPPSSIDGYPVISISGGFLKNSLYVRTLHLPHTVCMLKQDAFDLASSLEIFSVCKYNQSFVAIDGLLVNKNDSALIRTPIGMKKEHLLIPKEVKCIAPHAFFDCTDIKKISLHDGITEIGENAFEGCSDITNVILPPSVTVVKDGAFRDCESLRTIIFPPVMRELGEEVLDGCDSLEKIYTMPGSVAYNILREEEGLDENLFCPLPKRYFDDALPFLAKGLSGMGINPTKIFSIFDREINKDEIPPLNDPEALARYVEDLSIRVAEKLKEEADDEEIVVTDEISDDDDSDGDVELELEIEIGDEDTVLPEAQEEKGKKASKDNQQKPKGNVGNFTIIPLGGSPEDMQGILSQLSNFQDKLFGGDASSVEEMMSNFFGGGNRKADISEEEETEDEIMGEDEFDNFLSNIDLLLDDKE